MRDVPAPAADSSPLHRSVAGALLLVVVPILHVAVGLPHTGYATNYAVDRIAEHWVAVLAVCCLGGALWRALAR